MRYYIALETSYRNPITLSDAFLLYLLSIMNDHSLNLIILLHFRQIIISRPIKI